MNSYLTLYSSQYLPLFPLLVENFPPNITAVTQTFGPTALQDGADVLHADIMQLEVDQTYTFQVEAYDPNGDTVIYSLNYIKPGAAIDPGIKRFVLSNIFSTIQ